MAAYSGDVAAAQEEAVWDAKRNAVEQAVGLFLKSKTTGHNFGVEEDEISGRAAGFVRRWEIVEGSRRIETVATGTGKTGQILHIEVRATVEPIALLRRLSDMEDLYKDLERPRLRVQISGKGASLPSAQHIQQELASALAAQGFEVAASGAAEVELQGELEIVPTVRLGDKSAPYGVGEAVAACRATLRLRAVSIAGEDVLAAPRVDATGRSFQSDADAQTDAIAQIVQALLHDSDTQFVPTLLARWARERQDGHVVAVQVAGLRGGECERLKQTLAEGRGFRRFVDEQRTSRGTTLRFLTRRDTRSLRNELARFALNAQTPSRNMSKPVKRGIAASAFAPNMEGSASAPALLRVCNDRGPLIVCSAHAPAQVGPH